MSTFHSGFEDYHFKNVIFVAAKYLVSATQCFVLQKQCFDLHTQCFVLQHNVLIAEAISS